MDRGTPALKGKIKVAQRWRRRLRLHLICGNCAVGVGANFERPSILFIRTYYIPAYFIL